jgi:excisionase family DNA binding protein
MDRAPEPPPIGISDAEVAEILGVRELSVSRLVGRGVPHKPAKGRNRALDRVEVERIALERYRPSHPYWLTTREAADFLGVTRERVRQLAVDDRLPCVVHDGRRYYRRHQVEVIANARQARRA